MVNWRALVAAASVILSAGVSSSQVERAWFNRFDGPGGAFDAASDVAIDPFGNVVITGRVSGAAGSDVVTIKYAPSGAVLWSARFDGSASGDDAGRALAIDENGGVIVAGVTTSLGSGADYLVLRYSANGTLLWSASYDGPASGVDEASDVVVDASGAVTVTGRSLGLGGFDYATIRYTGFGSQVWVARYDGPASGPDFGKYLALDGSGATIVTGESDGGSTGQDIATVKYNASGVQQWVRRTPSAGFDTPTGLAVSPGGDIHVCGEGSNGFNQDYVVVKVSATNLLRWSVRYNGPGNAFDSANGIVLDSLGGVYVTGSSAGLTSNLDFATLKYDANGILQWTHRYNGTANGTDFAPAIAIDSIGNLYVSGTSQGNGTALDFATLRLNPSGQLVWIVRADGTDRLDDGPAAIAVDGTGAVAVAGRSESSGGNVDGVAIRYRQIVPNFDQVPIDLTGRYFTPNGAARARTAAVGGGQVDEPSGADEATFTPFSDAAKPPRPLRLNLLDGSYQYDLQLAGMTSGSLARIRAGALPGGFAQTFTVDSGSTTIGQSLASIVDSTGATAFRVRVEVEPSGFATTLVTRLDGSAAGTTLVFPSEPTTGFDSAAFEVEASGTSNSLGAFVISNFVSTAASNALLASVDAAYVRPGEPTRYRVRQYGLRQPVIGYQLFFAEDGPQTIVDLGDLSAYYTDRPFDSHFLDPRGVATDPGLAAGLGLPSQDHVLEDALLATLPYLAATEGVSNFSLRPNDGRSEVRSMFSDSQSREIAPSLFSPPIVLVDGTAPTLANLTATQDQTGSDNRIDKSVENGILTFSVDAGDSGEAPSGLRARPSMTVQFSSGGPISLAVRHVSGRTFRGQIAIDDTTPIGPATITVVAIDDAGNQRTLVGNFNVGIDPSSVTIQLTAIGLGFTNIVREVEFAVGGSGPGAPPVRVSKNVTFNDGQAIVRLDASDGLVDGVQYTRVSAKDPRHTLRRTVDTQGAGGEKTATIEMLSGDCSNDNLIDIIDYGIVASFFGQNVGRDTPIGSPPEHPDFNGNGIVQTIDVTFVTNSGQFLVGGDDEPGSVGRRPGPRAKASVLELLAEGAHRALEMDLDRDGWVTMEEIGAWLKARGR